MPFPIFLNSPILRLHLYSRVPSSLHHYHILVHFYFPLPPITALIRRPRFCILHIKLPRRRECTNLTSVCVSASCQSSKCTTVILKMKRSSDGSFEIFKDRIVACDNLRTFADYYMETYAPVVSFAPVRTFLYLAPSGSMTVMELDVYTVFLNGELSGEVWVVSPCSIPGRKTQ